MRNCASCVCLVWTVWLCMLSVLVLACQVLATRFQSKLYDFRATLWWIIERAKMTKQTPRLTVCMPTCFGCTCK